MVLGKGALSLQRGEHGHLRELSELQQLARGVGVEHTLAHVEERVLRPEQRPDGRLHVIRIGARSPALHRRIRVLRLVVLAEIARQEQQDGPGAARAELGEGAPEVVGHEVGAVDLAHPLRHGLEGLGHVEVGVPARALPHALRDDEKRRGIFPGLGDGAVGHLDARGIQVGHDRAHPDPLPARHPREAVGHGDGEALLAHHEDGHALFAEGVVHVIGGIAAHPRDALGLEDSGKAIRRLDLHRSPPRSSSIFVPRNPVTPALSRGLMASWRRRRACARACPRSRARR